MLYGFDSKPIMNKNDKLILTPGFGLLCFGLNYFPDSDIKCFHPIVGLRYF